ncbi:MAG: hypothetical protein ACKO9H_17310 [Planctomycetota bacterium]
MTTTRPRHHLTWTKSAQRSETMLASRWMMILTPHSVELPTNRGKLVRGNIREVSSDLGANSVVAVTNDHEAISAAEVVVENAVENAVENEEAIAASPAAKKAIANLVNSPNAERNAPQARAPQHRANNAPGKTEAGNNKAAATKTEATKARSDLLKAIARTKVEGTQGAGKAAKAASNRLVDRNVHNQTPPHPGERLPARLSLPAQPPKANQQKRNRCHIGNASLPCLD